MSPELRAKIDAFNASNAALSELMTAKMRDSEAGHHERACEMGKEIERRARRMQLDKYAILGHFEREHLYK